MRQTFIQFCLVGLAFLMWTAPTSATLVSVDFNDLATGDINGQTGGTGLSGTWSAPETIDVVAGDLSAPATTNFGLTQSSTAAQSLQGNGSTGKATTNLASTLTDTVWFSFLVNPTASGRGGINLDGSRILAVGTVFRVFLGSNDTPVNSQFTVGETALVVGKVEINADASGNDWFTAWIDPDVTNPGAATVTITDQNWINDGSIGQLGVETYEGGSHPANTVDLITLSNGPNGYDEVTGVIPEPSSVVLLLVGMAAWLVWRRRR